MKSLLLILTFSFFLISGMKGQSLELMSGTERIFADAQWLRTLDEDKKWSLFSRTRATVDYEENTNLFTGGYLNYTTPSGIGGTILGRISSQSAGSDAGVHFFKANAEVMLFALASVELSKELSYSWFSILRFIPSLSDRWKLFTGLELFTNFGEEGHVASVQRLRLGLSREGYQFGFGLNLSGIGKNYEETDTNPGIFIRKQF